MQSNRLMPRAAPPIPLKQQILVWFGPAYRLRQIMLALAAGVALLGLIAGPAGGTGLLMLAIGGCGLLVAAIWLYLALHFIDAHIRATVGAAQRWKVHSKSYPLYKFVDIHHAVRRFAMQQPGAVELASGARERYTYALAY